MRSSVTLAYIIVVALLLETAWSHTKKHRRSKTIGTVNNHGEKGAEELKIPAAFSGSDCFIINDIRSTFNGSNSELEGCHEKPDKFTPTVLRKIWDSAVELAVALDSPAEFVVIKDGGHSCNSSSDCVSQIKSMRKRSWTRDCDLRENFYVGGDSKVYEGRGWDSAPYWHLNGLGKKSITFQFLGLHERTPPSQRVIEAFEAAVEYGLLRGKLSKNFRITSLRQLLKDSVSEDALSQNPTESDRWASGEELSNFWEYTLPGRLRLVRRRQWNASKPTREFATIAPPVDYVSVSDGGDHCYSRSDCITLMRAIQAEHIDDYGDLLDNFYIGDGGDVYEGRGWNSVSHWFVPGLEGKFISVRILGSYVDDLPSWDAINSLKQLVQTGVGLGQISHGYRLFSLRRIYNQTVLLSNSFMEIVSKWPTWSSGDFISYTSSSYGMIPLKSRKEWNALASATFSSNNSQPINYVMIGDGGSRCFSIEQCSTRMRLEQNQSMTQYGDLLDNFYVGDDGVVYEGRGWDTLPFFNTPFFNDSLITVKFLGSFQNSQPSPPAWLAFLALLDAGIASEKISPDYKLYSFRHIYNDFSLLGDNITILFERMNAWDKQLLNESEDKRASSEILPIYSLNLPILRTEHKEYPPLKLPIYYVVVGDSGERCFTHKSCRACILNRYAEESRNFGYLSYNFYVGEDGSVFTGLGWNCTSYWHVRGVRADAIFVTFQGNFNNSLPSSFALLAFNRLLQFGVGAGKLAFDHKIISLRQLYPKSTQAGHLLAESIKSWGRWSEYQAFSPGGVKIPFGPHASVTRNHWNRLPQEESETLSYPFQFVIILDAGDSCTNLEICTMRVQTEYAHPQVPNSMENFYIGGDGRVYEGLGWFRPTHWHSKILNIDFVTVAFLGKFSTQPPSPRAITAFEYFLKEGIMSGKLLPNYSIVSLRQFIKGSQKPGHALDNYIRARENWSNDTSKAHVTDNFLIISRNRWGRTKSIRMETKIIHPLKYVYVREGGHSCSSNSECKRRMKMIESGAGGITENFYIGGDGTVCEGIGWFYDTKSGFEEWKYSITVQFLGTFERSLPSKNATEAFTALCRYGVRKRYVDPNYKVLFIPDDFDSRIWVGSELKKLLMSWERWVPNTY